MPTPPSRADRGAQLPSPFPYHPVHTFHAFRLPVAEPLADPTARFCSVMWWCHCQAVGNYRLCAADAAAGRDAAASRAIAVHREFTTLCRTYPSFSRAHAMAAALSLPQVRRGREAG